MNKFLLLPMLALLLAVAGCGDTETENLGGNLNEEVDQDEEIVVDEEESAELEENKIDQVVVDNENYKATLVEIVKKKDSIFGESIEAIFEIENKVDYTIVAQARSVSADGYMIDETILNMSQEVAGGKKAKAVLTIEDFEGYDFPELNEDFEMTLYMLNEDTYETIGEHDVKVSF